MRKIVFILTALLSISTNLNAQDLRYWEFQFDETFYTKGIGTGGEIRANLGVHYGMGLEYSSHSSQSIFDEQYQGINGLNYDYNVTRVINSWTVNLQNRFNFTPDRLINVYMNLLIGGGGATVSNDIEETTNLDNSNQNYTYGYFDQNSFYAISAGIGLGAEYNITRFLSVTGEFRMTGAWTNPDNTWLDKEHFEYFDQTVKADLADHFQAAAFSLGVVLKVGDRRMK